MHDRRLALQGRRNREGRGANRPPPNIFVGIKAKTSQTWNATFPPASLGFSDLPTALLCTVAVTTPPLWTDLVKMFSRKL